MQTDPTESFASNWDYLKSELRWLDQVLMLAVARQRKEVQDTDRVAQNKADRVSSHWWKGLVSLDGEIAYDEHRPAGSGVKVSYQQQLEAKIQLSYRRGVLLALPLLRDRLGLSLFEKKLVLMSLAPEMNRRYARLYRYLQGEDSKTDLPTVDLVLRLLCRNDSEWRSARTRLTTASPLMRLELLRLVDSPDTFLNRPLQLAEPLIRFLLSEQPNDQALELLLQSNAKPRPALLDHSTTTVAWSDLLLPAPLMTSMQYLEQRVKGHLRAEERWGFDIQNPTTYQPGAVALWVGQPGTGKTMAAGAIAHALETPLYTVDLAQIEPDQDLRLLEEILTTDPTFLLVKSAQRWLSRSSTLSAAALQQFLTQRRSMPGVTLFSVHHHPLLSHQWQRLIDQTLLFPMPGMSDRQQLWKRSVSGMVPLNADMDWERLASLPISGGEIGAIAHEAVLLAAAQEATKLSMSHIVQVLQQRGRVLGGRSGFGILEGLTQPPVKADLGQADTLESQPSLASGMTASGITAPGGTIESGEPADAAQNPVPAPKPTKAPRSRKAKSAIETNSEIILDEPIQSATEILPDPLSGSSKATRRKKSAAEQPTNSPNPAKTAKASSKKTQRQSASGKKTVDSTASEPELSNSELSELTETLPFDLPKTSPKTSAKTSAKTTTKSSTKTSARTGRPVKVSLHAIELLSSELEALPATGSQAEIPAEEMDTDPDMEDVVSEVSEQDSPDVAEVDPLQLPDLPPKTSRRKKGDRA
jgi:hypothetical protein